MVGTDHHYSKGLKFTALIAGLFSQKTARLILIFSFICLMFVCFQPSSCSFANSCFVSLSCYCTKAKHIFPPFAEIMCAKEFFTEKKTRKLFGITSRRIVFDSILDYSVLVFLSVSELFTTEPAAGRKEQEFNVSFLCFYRSLPSLPR